MFCTIGLLLVFFRIESYVKPECQVVTLLSESLAKHKARNTDKRERSWISLHTGYSVGFLSYIPKAITYVLLG